MADATSIPRRISSPPIHACSWALAAALAASARAPAAVEPPGGGIAGRSRAVASRASSRSTSMPSKSNVRRGTAAVRMATRLLSDDDAPAAPKAERSAAPSPSKKSTVLTYVPTTQLTSTSDSSLSTPSTDEPPGSNRQQQASLPSAASAPLRSATPRAQRATTPSIRASAAARRASRASTAACVPRHSAAMVSHAHRSSTGGEALQRCVVVTSGSSARLRLKRSSTSAICRCATATAAASSAAAAAAVPSSGAIVIIRDGSRAGSGVRARLPGVTPSFAGVTPGVPEPAPRTRGAPPHAASGDVSMPCTSSTAVLTSDIGVQAALPGRETAMGEARTLVLVPGSAPKGVRHPPGFWGVFKRLQAEGRTDAAARSAQLVVAGMFCQFCLCARTNVGPEGKSSECFWGPATRTHLVARPRCQLKTMLLPTVSSARTLGKVRGPCAN